MRWALGALACAAALWGAPATAVALPSNGQLAAVAGDRLVSLNPDGSGLRTLWTAPGGAALERPAWSPDGNRIAVSAGGRIAVYDVASGTARTVTTGGQDADPAWSGDRVAFRRGAGLWSVRADGTDARLDLALVLGTLRVSLAPDGRLAYVLGTELHVLNGLADQLVSGSVSGAPAWSPDSARIAFSTSAFQIVAVTPPGQVTTPVSPPGGIDTAPAWSPDGTRVAYVHDGPERELRIGSATVVRAALGDPAWQPCTPGLTLACESVAPPTCAAPPSATTQAGQPVDLPAPACTDPAGRALTVSVVEGPAHGTLTCRQGIPAPGNCAGAGARYTPAPGFSGVDTVGYRASNGVLGSDVVRQTIFVVPRNLGPVLVPQRRAPFLNARAAPRLDRRGRATLRAACDADCRVRLRLTARAGKKTLSGRTLARSLKAGKVVTLRLALRHRPRRRVRIAWIVGRVSGGGHTRRVKLPVTLVQHPRRA